VHDAHGLGHEDEVSHAVVARVVESRLELLIHGAVQALDLLARAFLYCTELKLLRGLGVLVGANWKGVRGIDTFD